MKSPIGLLFLALGAGVSLTSTAGAISRPPDPAPLVFDDVEEEILAILDDYSDAMEAFRKALGAAETEEARSELFSKEYPDASTYAARMWKVVELHPAHSASAEALAWIHSHTGDPDGRAGKLLLEHHIASEHISVLCFAYMQRSAGAQPTLQRIREAATTPEVKGLATMCLGQHLMSLADQAEKAQAADEEQLALLSERHGEDALIEWMDSDPALLRERGVALLEEVVAEYAQVAHPHGGTLGASAGGFLFELRHLAVGMIAPEIQGEDIAGVEFKLSDYRGKVIVLDFWGHW